VAAHLLAAEPGRDGWAAAALRVAAVEATRAGAPESAASYLDRALAEKLPAAVRAELLLELGESRLQARLGGAIEAFRGALDLCTEPRRRAEIGRSLGRALVASGDWAGAAEAFRQGLRERPDEDDDLSLELVGWSLTFGGEANLPDERQDAPGDRVERIRVLVEREAPGRTRMERLILAYLAYEAHRSGTQPREGVIRLSRRALADGGLLEESVKDPWPFLAACYALLFSGEHEAAVIELARAIDLSQRQGSELAFRQLCLVLATAHFLRGELMEALADLESVHRTDSERCEPGLSESLALLSACLLERDDLAGATRAVRLLGDQEGQLGQPSLRIYQYALGRLRVAQGQLREGLESLLACGHTATAINLANPAVSPPWRSDAALIMARLGERDRAAEILTEDLRLAQAFGAPHALGVALRAAGLIEGGRGGIDQLREAVAVLDGSGINLELARSLTEWGAALRRAGHRCDARQPLRRGLDLATSCGALALAARSREELVAAGGRPRRERLVGAAALTASELRVSQLANQGLTNRQIAQALFVSTKTVSTHLGHVYLKLGVSDRARLGSALSENGAIRHEPAQEMSSESRTGPVPAHAGHQSSPEQW
jgi:DNA-binding CsgD family transcriptional regulator